MDFNFTCTEPQAKFLQLPHKYRAFVAGYGCGKSTTLATAAILAALTSPKAQIGIFAPTYDLLRLVNIPSIMNKLDECGIQYKYNQQNNKITTNCNFMGDFIFRSLDNPERIVGFEIFAAFIDELDTLNTEHAEKAFNMVTARCRQSIKGHTNRTSVYTTPEGFKFVYNKWGKDPQPEFGMIQASSKSNPFLPPDYIDSLMKNYPPALRDAYIEGKFVNLTSGTVYKSFDETLNHTDTTYIEGEDIFVGMDFNISHTSGVILVKRANEYHVIDEIIDAYDTQEMADIINQRYGNKTKKIRVYPDAAGQQRRTSSRDLTDHIILQRAGFTLYVDGTNPRVRDRVNTVNAAFCNGLGERRLKINTKLCPVVTSNVKQQAYAKNGEPDKGSGNDHTNDALGYAICQLLPFESNRVTQMVKW